MLKSENLILKKPCKEDYQILRKVKPCEEFYLMLGSDASESIYMNDEKFDASFSELLNKEHHWYVFKGLEVIGVAFLHSIDAQDKRARFALGIYDKKNWNNGYGKELTQAILKYAFDQLKLHKVDLRVLAYNKRAIACYEKCGFVQEGVLRENAFINNEWHDDIIMSILCHEFQGK